MLLILISLPILGGIYPSPPFLPPSLFSFLSPFLLSSSTLSSLLFLLSFPSPPSPLPPCPFPPCPFPSLSIISGICLPSLSSFPTPPILGGICLLSSFLFLSPSLPSSLFPLFLLVSPFFPSHLLSSFPPFPFSLPPPSPFDTPPSFVFLFNFASLFLQHITIYLPVITTNINIFYFFFNLTISLKKNKKKYSKQLKTGRWKME